MGIPSTSNTGDQVRTGRRTWATRASSRLSTELDLLLLWSWVYLACLFPLEGPNSPSSTVSIGLFFPRSGLGFNPRSAGIWGGGRGGFAGGLDLFVSLGDGALFLLFISSLKLGPVLGGHCFLFVWSVSNKSYHLGRSLHARMLVCPLFSLRYKDSFFFFKLNLSISRSREEEEAIPSPTIASLSGPCCNGWTAKGIPCRIGWLTGRRSYEAKKPGQETSKRAKR